jgi:hypothetical protein
MIMANELADPRGLGGSAIEGVGMTAYSDRLGPRALRGSLPQT